MGRVVAVGICLALVLPARGDSAFAAAAYDSASAGVRRRHRLRSEVRVKKMVSGV
jgi:hypothetical protein